MKYKSNKKSIVEKKRLYETSWSVSYGHFPKIINKYKLKAGAEIGVAFGGHSETILNNTKVNKLYGIDTYKHRKDYDDPLNLSQKDFYELRLFANKRLKKFGDRFSLICKLSKEATFDISEKLDFVYLDADHSHQGVLNDLIIWFPKVRDGGIIGGHDYGHINYPGVKKAVDEFFNRFGWTIHIEGEGVWWVKKQPLRISFFIPAFNCETTIERAVESIVKTNFLPSGDEIIIVNDGSTDNTLSVLKEIKKRYPFLRILNHKKNRGGGTTRNTAIKAANNTLLHCLDADNILVSNSISKLRQYLIETVADIASFQYLYYFLNNRPETITHKWKFKSGLFTLSDSLSGGKNPGCSGNYLFTKRSWGLAHGYPTFAGALDTWGFSIRQLVTGAKMMIMPHSHYLHCYGHNSYWVRYSKESNISLTALQIIRPYISLLRDKDADYITSEKGKYVWFDNLEKYPIRLRQKPSEIQSITTRVLKNLFRLKIRFSLL